MEECQAYGVIGSRGLVLDLSFCGYGLWFTGLGEMCWVIWYVGGKKKKAESNEHTHYLEIRWNRSLGYVPLLSASCGKCSATSASASNSKWQAERKIRPCVSSISPFPSCHPKKKKKKKKKKKSCPGYGRRAELNRTGPEQEWKRLSKTLLHQNSTADLQPNGSKPTDYCS